MKATLQVLNASQWLREFAICRVITLGHYNYPLSMGLACRALKARQDFYHLFSRGGTKKGGERKPTTYTTQRKRSFPFLPGFQFWVFFSRWSGQPPSLSACLVYGTWLCTKGCLIGHKRFMIRSDYNSHATNASNASSTSRLLPIGFYNER